MKIGTIKLKKNVEAKEDFYDANKSVIVLLESGKTYDVYFSFDPIATNGFIRGEGKVTSKLNVDTIELGDIRTGHAYFNLKSILASKNFTPCNSLALIENGVVHTDDLDIISALEMLERHSRCFPEIRWSIKNSKECKYMYS